MGRTRKKREVIEEWGKIYFICTRCWEKKEATSDNFWKYKDWYLWLSASCKNCLAKNMRERMANNPDERQKRKEYLMEYHKKNKDKSDKWRKDNKELILKKLKEDRKNNPEKWKARDKKYYINNKEKILERAKLYREKNAEHYKRYILEYREAHKEERNEYNKKYSKEYIKRDYVKERRKRHIEEMWYAMVHKRTNDLINKLWVRPSICPICWKEAIIVSHHPDYSKYNEIVWCCNSCHQYIHKWKITEFEIVDLLA